MNAHVLVLKFQILVKEDAESEEETRKPKGMSERGFLQRPVKLRPLDTDGSRAGVFSRFSEKGNPFLRYGTNVENTLNTQWM
ncbi:MAG: hypothetical protein MUO52_05505 [Desulfobacterales bacterium]|nr:hypothetical protein [Desulfobacterales bacterium]